MTNANIIEKINKGWSLSGVETWWKSLFIAVTNLCKIVIIYGLVGVILLTPIIKGLWLLSKIYWNLLPF
jgi:hypothetical protein